MKSKRRVSNKKPLQLAERLIAEFKLVRDREFIRFKDGPSTLRVTLSNAAKDLGLKYKDKSVIGVDDSETFKEIQLIHYTSFVKNPLRYIFEMIDQAEISKKVKESRIEAVHRIVKEAMEEDPLSTVQTIIFSLARVARF